MDIMAFQHERTSMTKTKRIPKSITILIHGTFSRKIGRWHRPGSRLHTHIKNYVLPDVYCDKKDFFEWSGKASDGARLKAAKKLIKWCRDHPAESYNLIGHSHGANVASIASNIGLNNINKLVFLSPPVWKHKEDEGYLPNIDALSHKALYNFHAQRDLIVTRVANPPALQNYEGTSVAEFEKEFVIARVGHWAPLSLLNWLEDDIGEIISDAGLFELETDG